MNLHHSYRKHCYINALHIHKQSATHDHRTELRAAVLIKMIVWILYVVAAISIYKRLVHIEAQDE